MSSSSEEAWSSNRGKSKDEIAMEKKRILNGIEGLNGCLLMLSKDKDFQSDLKSDIVIKALKHWSGEQRLPSEQAHELFASNYIIAGVLSKIQRIQYYSSQIGIPVPLDHLIDGKTSLDFNTNKVHGDQGNEKSSKDKIKKDKKKKKVNSDSSSSSSSNSKKKSKKITETTTTTNNKSTIEENNKDELTYTDKLMQQMFFFVLFLVISLLVATFLSVFY